MVGVGGKCGSTWSLSLRLKLEMVCAEIVDLIDWDLTCPNETTSVIFRDCLVHNVHFWKLYVYLSMAFVCEVIGMQSQSTRRSGQEKMCKRTGSSNQVFKTFQILIS